MIMKSNTVVLLTQTGKVLVLLYLHDNYFWFITCPFSVFVSGNLTWHLESSEMWLIANHMGNLCLMILQECIEKVDWCHSLPKKTLLEEKCMTMHFSKPSIFQVSLISTYLNWKNSLWWSFLLEVYMCGSVCSDDMIYFITHINQTNSNIQNRTSLRLLSFSFSIHLVIPCLPSTVLSLEAGRGWQL